MAEKSGQKQSDVPVGSPPAAGAPAASAEQGLSEGHRNQVSEIVAAQLAEAWPAETEAEFPDIPEDIPDATLEACVQVAAVLTHRLGGTKPDGFTLLDKCGQRHVDAVEKAGASPDEVCAWACAEASRRSSALNHKAIVAQSIV